MRKDDGIHTASTTTGSVTEHSEEDQVEMEVAVPFEDPDPPTIREDAGFSMSEIVERVDNIYPHAKLATGWGPVTLMAMRSLGIIYGDIGTSPLYVLSSVFIADDIPVNKDTVLGVASLIIWSLFLIVTIKYIGLVMKLDNHGEGGIFALLSLVPPVNPKLRNFFVAATLLGSSLVIGDGVITPAISVLSAIEGIETQAKGMSAYVVVITVVIIIGIYSIQSFGTSKIGVSFGPIMLLWFTALSIFGLIEIVKNPVVLAAFSPSYGMKFLFSGQGGILVLGTVVLCVTGVEALYADLGHFGRPPIRMSWFGFVFPALILNYLGQSAYLLDHPEDLAILFYKSVPSALFWPMLILATLATIIASQAMISGVFSLINQAVSFQFFPSVKVVHTSSYQFGQVYIPEINYIMMVLTLVVVVTFQKSSNLSAAYGVAVTGVMFLTSIMYISVLHLRNRTAWWKLTIFGMIFCTIDLTYFGATLTKIPDGGWLPLVIGLVFATVMWVWKMGREELESYNQSVSLSYDNLKTLLQHYDVSRVPTSGVFMTSRYDATPQSISVLLPRMRSLPSPSIFLTVKFVPVPYISEKDRVTLQYVSELDGVIYAVVVYGFAEVPQISQVIQKVLGDKMLSTKQVASSSYDLNIPPVTYYLSRERVLCDGQRWIGHRLWVILFDLLLSNSRSKADVFGIPAHEMVDVGFIVVL